MTTRTHKSTGRRASGSTNALIILSIVLSAFLLTALLSSCADRHPDDTPSDSSSATPPDTSTTQDTPDDTSDTAATGNTEAEVPGILLAADGKAVYRMIVAENAASAFRTKAGTLMKAFADQYGTDIEYRTDFVYRGESAENDIPEILIGKTNRPESISAMEKINDPGEFYIDISGCKITIAAANVDALEAALGVFISAVRSMPDNGKTLYIDKDMALSGKVDIKERLVLLANQRASEIQVHDISRGNFGTATLVWKYKTSEYNIAGLKTRIHPEYGQVIIAAYGGSSALMVSYPEGKLIWSTNQTAANPHSPEYIPTENGGVIAVAASTGNEVRFFDEKSEAVKYSLPFQDSHGVLWDPDGKCLWVIGRTSMKAYTVSKNAEGVIAVEPIEGKQYSIPSDYAHDLQPVYGDKNLLWVTTSSAVYQFDKTTGKFSTDFQGIYKNLKITTKNIKGIGNFEDGTVISMYPDGSFKSWTTGKLQAAVLRDGKYYNEVISGAGESYGFYKCRVFVPEYQ